MNFIEDKELNLTEEGNDLLNGQSYSKILKQIIQEAPEKTFTIGLFGEWGSGKSSIIKTVKDSLENDNAEKIKFVVYDAWKYVNDSFHRMFLLTLQKELNFERSDLMKKFYSNNSEDSEVKIKFNISSFNWVLFLFAILILISLFFISYGNEKIGFSIAILSLFSTLFFKCFNELKVVNQKPYLFAPEQFEECFKQMISKSLKKNTVFEKLQNWVKGENYITDIDKLIIVLDNIDRCSCEVAYNLLTNIKSFMNEYHNLIFIIPVDDRALKKHIINSKNSDKDAEEFFRKFFNVELRIKSLENVELFDYTSHLNEKYNLKLNADTIDIIASEYATNPRRIIQFLNNLTTEFSLLSENYGSDFVCKNQGLICKALIIKEEWSEYFNKIIKDNSLLIEQRYNNEDDKFCKTVECSELNSFLSNSFFLTHNADLSIVDKILHNSTKFQEIPQNLVDALQNYDLDKLNQYIEISQANLQLTVKFLFDNLQKSINRNLFENKVPQMVIAILAINHTHKLSRNQNINLKTLILDKIDKFIEFIPEKYMTYISYYINDLKNDNYLLSELGKYFEININASLKNSDNIFKLYSTILLNCTNVAVLKKCFIQWYRASSDTISKLQLSNKLQTLISDELIQYEIENLQDVENESFAFKDLIYIAKYCKLTTKQETMIFSQINKNFPKYEGNNIERVLTGVKYLSELLTKIKINGNDSFISYYNGVFQSIKRQVGYQWVQQTLLTSIGTEIQVKIIIDFLKNVYIAGLNNPSIINHINFIYDRFSNIQEYIISAIKDIINAKITISLFSHIVFNYNQISENSLLVFEKIIREQDSKGNYAIENSLVTSKINYLLDNIKNENYKDLINKFFENNMSDERIKNCLIKSLSSRDKDVIIALSSKLQKIACNKISEDIHSYENDTELLGILARYGNKSQIMPLTKLLISKLASDDNSQKWKDLYYKIPPKNIDQRQKEKILIFLEDEKEIA